MAGLTFEWDPDKAKSNLLAHRVPFDEALTVFADPLAAIHDDPDHSAVEPREIIVGTSHRARLLVVVFTERPSSIRLISARKASRHERKAYEEHLQASQP